VDNQQEQEKKTQGKKIAKAKEEERCAGTGEENPGEELQVQIG
jgi:hypothetical protein